MPVYRHLKAAEPMAAAGAAGTDFSANAPSLAGLTLLLDDQAGGSPPTLVVLAGAPTNGGQGGSLDMAGIPHTGRIRIYSSAANCQIAARSW